MKENDKKTSDHDVELDLDKDVDKVIGGARLAGVDLPKDNRVEIGLTYIWGIGRKKVK